MPLHVNSALLQFSDDVKMFRSVNLKRENRDRKKVLKQGEDSGNKICILTVAFFWSDSYI